MALFSKKMPWPKLSIEEIRKRSRLLVIDDKDFFYYPLFQKDGYTIDKWDDVEDLNKLETRYYDVVLLDIQGVGREHSTEEGLGLLKHIRKVSPMQVVIAYSDADWSLKYQEFFKMADDVLAKTADYVEFKRSVDKVLEYRFSLGFYLEKAMTELTPHVDNPERARKILRNAIETRSTDKLKKYLGRELEAKDIMASTLQIIQIAIGVAALCG